MYLTVTNLTTSSASLGGKIGVVRGATVKTVQLTIAELEAIRAKLSYLTAAGKISFSTATSISVTDDAAEGATVGVVNLPLSFTFSGAFTFLPVHLGGVIHATGAGAQAASLPNLSSSLQPNRELILTVQPEGAATAVTITPASGCQINAAGSGVAFVATVGRTRISLCSKDGVNWYSGS
jgi:hypothetical protein